MPVREFWPVLHAEWTKFRTVRGWPIALVAAALMIVALAVLTGLSGSRPDGGAQIVPVGPGGEPVTDTYYFVHRPLASDGSITVPFIALTERAGPQLTSATVPWAKAGLLVTSSLREGAPYAAIMTTAAHGVRMQYNYTGDVAAPGAVGARGTPRWLRLTRAGDDIDGYVSGNGTTWTPVSAVRLANLPPVVQAGLFVACPALVRGAGTDAAVATGIFGRARLQGEWAAGPWTESQVGSDSASFSGYPSGTSGGYARHDQELAITGAGDLAPAVRGSLPSGGVLGDLLFGTFAALIAVITVGALCMTSEFRVGLIRTTLAATPRRGQVLAAKAVVLAAATFAAGLVGAAVAIPAGMDLAREHGTYLFPVTGLTQLRVAVGTAALLAITAVLALGAGAVLRRSAAAVTVITAAVVFPYLAVGFPFLPAAVADWLTRVTPIAAFAVQQTLRPVPQVASVYTPANGYYALPAWAGLAVLSAYALTALMAGALRLRRLDA
jgi:hypothetical protein